MAALSPPNRMSGPRAVRSCLAHTNPKRQRGSWPDPRSRFGLVYATPGRTALVGTTERTIRRVYAIDDLRSQSATVSAQQRRGTPADLPFSSRYDPRPFSGTAIPARRSAVNGCTPRAAHADPHRSTAHWQRQDADRHHTRCVSAEARVQHPLDHTKLAPPQAGGRPVRCYWAGVCRRATTDRWRGHLLEGVTRRRTGEGVFHYFAHLVGPSW